ncbi:ARPP-1 family domain-containing protein [Methanothermobacter sp.]|uniref:ARPP-1 family domain-containing protein n=1 Tax=Methanothermobacter sp. TaxID=1884223 RepID=UPI003C7894C7
MDEIAERWLGSLEFLKPQVSGQMEVIPLRAPEGSQNYITLKEAMSNDLISIGEVDEYGSVTKVLAVNRAAEPVLIIDGEELEGAKQNRVANATVLVPEKSETIIPVSCVEQGRWSYTSKEFRDPERVAALNVRVTKTRTVTENLENLGRRAEIDYAVTDENVIRDNFEDIRETNIGNQEELLQVYCARQSSVWDEVNRLHRRTGSTSKTGAMADAYRKKRKTLEEFKKPFKPVKDQKGVLVAINGRIAGFEFISRSSVYRELHDKIIKSYAIEAMLHDEATYDPVDHEDFIERIMNSDEHRYPSPGYGIDHRYTSEGLVGSALTHAGEVIHSVFFNLQDDSGRIRGYRERAETMMRNNNYI